ncbi:MAG TPA: DUF4386 family protein [Noviherbaspirillum sp.]|nr:DUF4386 family protein [Noviherbaspirillum sp.]
MAIGGALALFIGSWLHPMHADPNIPSAAFQEYAADPHWISTHLIQLLGVVLMVAALIVLSRKMAGGRADVLAAVGAAAATAGAAVAAALQAVDGVALQAMVHAWAAAAAPDKDMLFFAALAVRQIEIGLAAMGSLVLGATVVLFGAALLVDGRCPRWIGWLGLISGLPGAVAGIVIAYTGFSELAMNVNMPASVLMLVWMIALGVALWRWSAAPNHGGA